MDRRDIDVELERAAADFHRLLESATRAELGLPTDGTKWTNKQLLFHMLFGFILVRALVPLVKGLGRLPSSVSRTFAAILNAGTRPFHVINYLGALLGGAVLSTRAMGKLMDRTIERLRGRLARESEHTLGLAMHFPVGWDPYFKDTMTVGDVYHYPSQHYEHHRRQLTTRRALTGPDRPRPDVGGDACCEVDDGLLRAGLSEVAARLATVGFAALWHGRSLTPGELLPGNVDEAVEAATTLVAAGRAEVDGAGRVVGIHGLTLRHTRHRFHLAGRPHNTWCAFDSVGIPAALGLDAVARTDCPTCGAEVTVEIVGGIPNAADAVLWLPKPPAANLLAEFCSSADLFCNPDHLQERIRAGRLPDRVCDLEAAAALGRTTWADIADTTL
jgi:hypothetical protein